MLNRLFAVWSLILILLLAPITVLELKSLEIDDYDYDTSGRDDDDDEEYCEDTYNDASSCNADSRCEWDDGECDDYDVLSVLGMARRFWR